MTPIWKSRTAANRDGNVAIEFGLILPALLLFSLGIIDMGRLLWFYTAFSQATEAAARCGTMNNTPITLCPNITAYAAAQAQAWGLNGVTAANFSLLKSNCGVEVQGTYTFQFLIPWFPQFGATNPFGTANQMQLTTTACYARQF